MKKLSILILALVVVASCTKIKESPEPVQDSGNTGGGGGGGGGGGNPAVYLGLWKMNDRTVDGTNVWATVDSVLEVHLEAGGKATWNYYVGNNVANTEADNYILNTSSSPATIDFTKKGTRTIVNKTGTKMTWSYAKNGSAYVEEYTKQ